MFLFGCCTVCVLFASPVFQTYVLTVSFGMDYAGVFRGFAPVRSHILRYPIRRARRNGFPFRVLNLRPESIL
jgi:hypothetical protein